MSHRGRPLTTLTGRSLRLATSGGRIKSGPSGSISPFVRRSALETSRSSRAGRYTAPGGPSVPVHPVERKLAAIFAADIAGYSRLMARDEVDTLARLKACRAIIDQLIEAHRGRIFNTAGDSVVG